MAEKYPITTWMPVYEDARRVLRVLEGVRLSNWQSMNKSINDKWKSPEFKGIWKTPHEYIPVVISLEDQELAHRIWHETKVLPHYAFNTVELAQNNCLGVFDGDCFSLTATGQQFLKCDDSTLEKIDCYEGILVILSEVADKSPGTENDFLTEFRGWLHSHSTFSPKNSGLVAQRYRLINLRRRGLIEKKSKYSITDAGLEYLRRVGSFNDKERPTLEEEVNRNNTSARQQLGEFLQTMQPYAFEHLIKRLLEAMGYDNVEVTSVTNDKGVDVVGDIELGISRVREVIQVKRQQANVGRVVLDSLRGSLHRFDAVRATIVSTGKFSKTAKAAAFDKGAAPITLIDGERLLDLLMEHDIGIRRREIRVFEFDPESLSEFEDDAVLPPSG